MILSPTQTKARPIPLQGLQPELGLGLQYGPSYQQLTKEGDVELLGLWATKAGLLGQEL